MSKARKKTERRPSDDYQTPRPLATAFCDLLDWTRIRSVMEPCRGAGAFYDVFPGGRTKHWCEIRLAHTQTYGERPRNYLDARHQVPTDATITNPPYSIFTAFLTQALHLSPFVALLLRINVWGGQRRLAFWKNHPAPSHQLAVVPRPSFFQAGGSDFTEYAFFCWDRLGVLRHVPPFWFVEWKKPRGMGKGALAHA